jgi:hypothetical protein
MTLTLYEAHKLSRNPLTRGVFKALATPDQLLSQIAMVPKSGESFVYDREKALPAIEFVTPNHTSLTESSATFDKVTVPMRLIATNIDVMNFVEEQMGDTNAQMATQLSKKLKALGRTIGQKLITGGFQTSTTLTVAIAGVTAPSAGPNQDTDRHGPGILLYDQSAEEFFYQAPGDRTYGVATSSAGDPGQIRVVSDNPNRWIDITVASTAALPAGDVTSLVTIASTTNEWDGLAALVASSQTRTASGANGDALALATMDKMIDVDVRVRERRFFVMNGLLLAKFFALVRAIPGAREQVTVVPGVNGPVPVYRGIPILQSDWIASNETKGSGTTLSSVYLLSLAPEEGFWLGVSQGGGRVNVDIDPRSASVLGVRLRDIGELEDKDAKRTRVTFNGAPALGSELAVARASQLVTA